MHETKKLEFKETITNTFLKTVSAFSNYDGGEIFFGIDDNGNVKGMPNVRQSCLDIENKINDSIQTQPDYTLEIQSDNTIKLTVKGGAQKPYLYKSHFPGIDIVKFGQNISIIQKRATFDNISVLDVYDKTLDVFRDYYRYEVIQGAERKNVERIPEAAFREAIANALIHRVWDVESQIRVLMFDDRIEIISPGGLPSGITEEEYLSGKLSVFEENMNLTEDERTVYKILSRTVLKSISEIAPYVSFGKSKTIQILKDLIQKGIVTDEGKGRGTKYIIK